MNFFTIGKNEASRPPKQLTKPCGQHPNISPYGHAKLNPDTCPYGHARRCTPPNSCSHSTTQRLCEQCSRKNTSNSCFSHRETNNIQSCCFIPGLPKQRKVPTGIREHLFNCFNKCSTSILGIEFSYPDIQSSVPTGTKNFAKYGCTGVHTFVPTGTHSCQLAPATFKTKNLSWVHNSQPKTPANVCSC